MTRNDSYIRLRRLEASCSIAAYVQERVSIWVTWRRPWNLPILTAQEQT